MPTKPVETEDELAEAWRDFLDAPGPSPDDVTVPPGTVFYRALHEIPGAGWVAGWMFGRDGKTFWHGPTMGRGTTPAEALRWSAAVCSKIVPPLP